MRNFSNLLNSEIHKIWDDNSFESQEEIIDFRKELVKRGFCSWDEIDTKFECIPATINEAVNVLFLDICKSLKIDKLCKWLNNKLETRK